MSDYEKWLEMGYVNLIKPELESRNRILRDCVELLNSTKNVDTLTGRMETLYEQVNWMCDRLNEGYPLRLHVDGKDDFKTAMFDYANDKAVRLANRLVCEFRDSKHKTEKVRENKLFKLRQNLYDIKKSLLQTDNYQEKLNTLNEYLNDIEEVNLNYE